MLRPMRLPDVSRWPTGAGTVEAIGYLMARPVPARELPAGLVLIRRAAGWIAADSQQGTIPSLAHLWLSEVRALAVRLGPPPDLVDLLALLADGIIRSETAARAVLTAAGVVGEAADPRVLTDFATWTGAELPFTRIPIGRRCDRPVFVYASQVSDLGSARGAAAHCMRSGVVAASRLLDRLNEAGIRLDLSRSEQDVKDVLGLLGADGWVWQRRDGYNPLAKTMKRLSALAGPIPVARVPDAVQRSTTPRRPSIDGEWPSPRDAVCAWAHSSLDWTLTTEDMLQARTPAAVRVRSDQVVLEVFRRAGPALTWKQLHDQLIHSGLTPMTATATVNRSPLMCHQGRTYALLDAEPA